MKKRHIFIILTIVLISIWMVILHTRQVPPIDISGWNIPIKDWSKQRQYITVIQSGVKSQMYNGHGDGRILKNGYMYATWCRGHAVRWLYWADSTDDGKTWDVRENPRSLYQGVYCSGQYQEINGIEYLYYARKTEVFGEHTIHRYDIVNKKSEYLPGIPRIYPRNALKLSNGNYLGVCDWIVKDEWIKACGNQYPSGKIEKMIPRITVFNKDMSKFISDKPLTDIKDRSLNEGWLIHSPNKKEIACLLREESHLYSSYVVFSTDEGMTWSKPQTLPPGLTGDQHEAIYLPDGRMFITMKDVAIGSPTKGDMVAWIGNYEDLTKDGKGYRIRLIDTKRDGMIDSVQVLNGHVYMWGYGSLSLKDNHSFYMLKIPLTDLVKQEEAQ